ncbi:MAG: ABC transporter permease, partial [Planctomycetes bacterium]|nr:ABC transporter permease [Planctomycetota bacterium]
MWTYFIRRALFSLPILVSVNLITFFIFFFVNSPDDVARTILGDRRVRPSDVHRWKKEHGYDLPLFFNARDRVVILG